MNLGISGKIARCSIRRAKHVNEASHAPPANAIRIVRGHTFEDFQIGRVFEHLQRKTLLESDNSLFTTLTLHYNPVYLDRERAKAAGYRDIPINPLLVFNTVFGISVEDLSEGGGPFLGVGGLEYGIPVYAGDTLHASSTVRSARLSAKHEHYAIVSWTTRGLNQSGDQVVIFNRTNLVRRRR
jgi:itaconyl-CoA hydratase